MDLNRNKEIIQQCYADFNRGNIQGILNVLTDDVSWNEPGYPDIPFGGQRRGKVEVQDFFKRNDEECKYTTFEPRTYITQDNQVAVTGYCDGTAKKTGKPFKSDWVMEFTMENNRIKKYQSFYDTNDFVKSLKK